MYKGNNFRTYIFYQCALYYLDKIKKADTCLIVNGNKICVYCRVQYLDVVNSWARYFECSLFPVILHRR